ncbi:VanZ family protein [Brevibacillus reuszeri]|uniref:VanZ family protein n=1 Tax=Brevibacillus reuszeri TaxID=54915 RepID=UPI002896C969|nr:VanZ family protein [Brevibacillus reuszeri]
MNNVRKEPTSGVMVALLKYGVFALYLFLVFKILLLKFGSMELELFYGQWQQSVSNPSSIWERLQYRGNLVPFHEIERYLVAIRESGSVHSIINLFGNIIAFMPFGFMVPLLFSKKAQSLSKVVALSFLFSLGLETTQLVTNCGIFDVDDILLNTTGGALGYSVYLSYRLMFWWKSKKSRTLVSEAH